MRKFYTGLTCAAAAAVSLALSVDAASAACTKLGFSVNDYGKEGPTNDAKSLLDKYIAKWAADRGIAKYTTGKKDVTCELFLNFIVFDEHTCKAEATVCWDGPAVKGGETASVGEAADKPKVKATKAAAVKAPAPKAEHAAGVVTGSTTPAAAASEEAAPAAAAAPAATEEAPGNTAAPAQ